ncbi:5'-nucleotidase C-terminal domain-containing protein [Brevibacillus dissolubilis]|uniref:5'-nucleotidase C-terminal domain-containing protein n=1 Tax=Brevibacillus dissolubilis TaxID=1844116 RepID=UPI00111768CE|nr:5'-nucleotidase C-terminal domain-containing protein [Brevibacillus dissolubilis]
MLNKKPVTLLVTASLTASVFAGNLAVHDVASAATKETASAKTSDMVLAQQYGWLDRSGVKQATEEVRRSDLAAILVSALELKKAKNPVKFSDVPAHQQDAVNRVVAAGLMEADGEKFAPARKVTREEYAEIIANAIAGTKIPTVDTSVLNYFKDASTVEDRNVISYAVLKGILDLKFDSELRLQAAVTLEEAVSGLKPLVFEDIDVLSTNDIHGNIEYNTTYKNGGMGIVAGVVNQYRTVNPDGTIVLDAGDFFQGTLISNAFEGTSTLETMDAIGYDAGTIGNHEFDFGQPLLKKLINEASFPIISANIYDKASNKPVSWTKPYTIVEKDGYRVGIIGLSTVETPKVTLSTHISDLSFAKGSTVSNELVKELKKQTDFVIVNSHMPGDLNAQGEIIGELADFAREATGVEAVIGGHSHKRVFGHINDVALVEAQTATAAIGHIRLFVDKKKDAVVSTESSILETKLGLAKADAQVEAIVAKYQTQVNQLKGEVVSVTTGALTRDSVNQIKRGKIDKEKAREGVTPLGNLITEVMRSKENVQIAFTNIGGIRTDIDAGEITYGEVFSVLPFDNYDVVGEMTAQQLKTALEVLDKYSGYPALQQSGLKYKWDNRRAAGDKITEITLTDGTPVYVNGTFSDQKFSVTTNNFLGTGSGDGYTVFGQVKWTDTPNFQREIVAEYLRNLHKQGKTISPIIDDRETRLDF